MTWIAEYGAPVLGLLLIATGVGGAVVGGYGAVQEDFGWCGRPAVGVTPADETEYLSANGTIGPRFSTIDTENLTDAERHAVEEAIEAPNNVGELVNGSFEHEERFRDGTILHHEGTTYYATIETMDECVAVNRFVFPLSLAGVLVGGATYLLPSLQRRRAKTGEGLRGVVREGRYADPATFVAFGTGVGLAVLPLLIAPVVSMPLGWLAALGMFVGGASVGLVATSTLRAVVLGSYLGVVSLLVTLAVRWWFATPIETPLGVAPTSFVHAAVVVGLSVVGAVLARALT